MKPIMHTKVCSDSQLYDFLVSVLKRVVEKKQERKGYGCWLKYVFKIEFKGQEYTFILPENGKWEKALDVELKVLRASWIAYQKGDGRI